LGLLLSSDDLSFTLDLAISLTNHYRATPPLVRYGAALCLHTIVKLSPGFFHENKYFYLYIISGLLDTDYQTSFIYESMLLLLKSPLSAQIKTILDQVHHNGTQQISYDRLYVQLYTIDDSENNRSQLLQLIAKQTPPVASILLHKMANALDYMTHQEKLRQLTLIKFWGLTSGKSDVYLMRILLPFCTSLNETLQMEALKVVRAFIPGFMDANPAEISFVWNSMYPLLDSSLKSPLLLESIGILKMFPLTHLSSSARDQLMDALLKLFFYTDPEVREKVYKFIGGCGEVWKVTGEFARAISLLILALGDSDPNWYLLLIISLTILIEQIQLLGAGFITPLNVTIQALKEVANKSILVKIKAYDNLCIALALNKVELKAVIDALIVVERTDQFWNFFLHDVQENQLARVNEYDYSRNYISNPFWIALFCTKFNVQPPPLVYKL
jgi:hypothetical protein